MRFCITLTLFFAISNLTAQNRKEKELKTTINEVTVFLDGAQIFETGVVSVSSGKSLLRIKNLSPYIDDKSIQVKAEGKLTILSVNHKFNYLNELKKDNTIDSLSNQLDALQADITKENARLEVLHEKQTLLTENRNLGGVNNGTSLTQLKQAMDFYDAEIMRIKEEEIRIHRTLSDKKEKESRINQQLKEQRDRPIQPTSEIEIHISSEAAGSAKFSITYLVANAGWFPKYDVRVINITSPLTLAYKAEVFQNTGVDWKNVKLRFSNGSPNQSGLMPELSQWNLNYARNTIFDSEATMYSTLGSVKGKVIDGKDGTPVVGANVVIKGTTLGTVTDVNGNFSLTLPNPNVNLAVSFIGYAPQEIPVQKGEMTIVLQDDIVQLNEVVGAGLGVSRSLQGRAAGISIRGKKSFKNEISTTVIENQTTVEIEVDVPYTIKSDGEKLMVDLKQYSVDATYEYYAVPKIDKDAFLMAHLVNWDQYNLLEGEANLYFEDAYIGRSILNAKALTDTLTLSLGRDKNIVIGRTKVEQFSKKRFIGSNITETRGFKILVRNKKSQPIKLTLFDQIPVSVLSEIEVTPVELSQGKLNNETGKITWQQTIDPQQQKELLLQYEVKYPKRENVILE